MSSSNDSPTYFQCPLSKKIMIEPVLVQCGHMFDRLTLLSFLKNQMSFSECINEPSTCSHSNSFVCPICNTEMDSSMIIPCFSMQLAIQDWLRSTKLENQEKTTKNSNLNSTSSSSASIPTCSNAFPLSHPRSLSDEKKSILQPKVKLCSFPFFSFLQFKWLFKHKKKKKREDSVTSSTLIPSQPISNTTTTTTSPTLHPHDHDTTIFNSSVVPLLPTTYPPSASLTSSVCTQPTSTFQSNSIKQETSTTSSHPSPLPVQLPLPCLLTKETLTLIPTWAILIPMLPIHPTIYLNRTKFYIGRHSACHARVVLSEISSVHFCIYREKHTNGCYQMYIEDCSTNGTFLNGQSLGKGHIQPLFPNDEISIGKKNSFTKKELPEVSQFIDAVFSDTLQQQPHLSSSFFDPLILKSIAQLKQVPSFLDLLSLIDSSSSTSIKNTTNVFSIPSSQVQLTLMSALHAWKHEHRFPTYVVHLVDSSPTSTPISTPTTTTITTPISTTTPTSSFSSNLLTMSTFAPYLNLNPHEKEQVSLIVFHLHSRFPSLSFDLLLFILFHEPTLQRSLFTLSTNQVVLLCSEKIQAWYLTTT